MKKKSLILSFVLTLLMAMTMILSGCGSSPSTLEDYVNTDEELAETIEAYETSGMTIDVTGNTLTYTYKYDQTFDESTAALMTSELEKAMSSMDSTFEGVKDTLIEETGFSDIVVKIVYTDGSDAVLYEKSY